MSYDHHEIRICFKTKKTSNFVEEQLLNYQSQNSKLTQLS